MTRRVSETLLVGFCLLQIAGAGFNFVEDAKLSQECGESNELGSACIRLHNNILNQRGAVWWDEELPVTTDFETTFQFRIVNQSDSCADGGDDTGCATRGGHGFAFVIHKNSAAYETIGNGDSGLGYGGLRNVVALEFDTWYNSMLGDLYQNHISVSARGYRARSEPHHQYSLGQSSEIPDISDGEIHTVKVTYAMEFDPDIIHQSKCVAIHACAKLESLPNFANLLAEGYFNEGVGLMTIFFDDMVVPKFIVPMRFSTVLDLSADIYSVDEQGNATNATDPNNGTTAIMGFTASSGKKQSQIMEVLRWDWCGGSNNQSSEEWACNTLF